MLLSDPWEVWTNAISSMVGRNSMIHKAVPWKTSLDCRVIGSLLARKWKVNWIQTSRYPLEGLARFLHSLWTKWLCWNSILGYGRTWMCPQRTTKKNRPSIPIPALQRRTRMYTAQHTRLLHCWTGTETFLPPLRHTFATRFIGNSSANVGSDSCGYINHVENGWDESTYSNRITG